MCSIQKQAALWQIESKNRLLFCLGILGEEHLGKRNSLFDFLASSKNPIFLSLGNEEGKLAKIPGDGNPRGPHWEL